MSNLYDTDFLQWTERQTDLLRRMAAGESVNEAPDWRNLAEENRERGRTREARSSNALRLLHLDHLLNGVTTMSLRNWRDAIYFQRQALLDLFDDSPSLCRFAERVLSSAFTNGRQAAEAGNRRARQRTTSDRGSSEGRSSRKALEVRTRLRLIFHHLLRWCYQPDLRSRNWRDAIYFQRQALLDLFDDSPSLRPFAERVLSSSLYQWSPSRRAGNRRARHIRRLPVAHSNRSSRKTFCLTSLELGHQPEISGGDAANLGGAVPPSSKLKWIAGAEIRHAAGSGTIISQDTEASRNTKRRLTLLRS